MVRESSIIPDQMLVLKNNYFNHLFFVLFCFAAVGSENGKSLFLLLSKIKSLPSLEAQKDLIKWLLQVFKPTHIKDHIPESV